MIDASTYQDIYEMNIIKSNIIYFNILWAQGNTALRLLSSDSVDIYGFKKDEFPCCFYLISIQHLIIKNIAYPMTDIIMSLVN